MTAPLPHVRELWRILTVSVTIRRNVDLGVVA